MYGLGMMPVGMAAPRRLMPATPVKPKQVRNFNGMKPALSATQGQLPPEVLQRAQAVLRNPAMALNGLGGFRF